MSDEFKSTLTIASAEEFEAALAAVVETAIKSDIDIRGAWEFRHDGAATGWEINITELAKRLDDGEQEGP